jgi:hypothetical protein
MLERMKKGKLKAGVGAVADDEVMEQGSGGLN